jgi:uncharacterized protein (DUF3084 family)
VSEMLAQTVPSAEQINLEYRLSQSKANEAVQHAINCGLMLLQKKADLAHGQWLPWLKEQREAGVIEFTDRTANRYIKIASNPTRVSDLPDQPSIRAALELLSDKPQQDDAQSSLELETEKERKAREAAELRAKEAEEKAAEAEERAEAFRQQDNEKLRKLREQEQLVQTAQAQAAALRKSIAAEAKKLADDTLASVRAEADEAKLQKIEIEQKLKTLRKQQDKAVEKRAKEVIQAQQDEINRREAQLQGIERSIELAKAKMQSIGDEARIRAHFSEATNDIKQHLNDLSASVQFALDPDYTDYMPAEFVPIFEKLAREMASGAQGIEQMLSTVDIRAQEVAVNG